ncbi:clostripain-related cysteine peptidase [Eubacterium xylanophilum]|uniref:clostripain-related cysteine peptidase n=1 Tax=Eubacterium xylanophilum TaxID=39497 RepID=UPI00047BB66F|nr:clostripain-related cysteine peptidase [Eubacterium xylanophilum]
MKNKYRIMALMLLFVLVLGGCGTAQESKDNKEPKKESKKNATVAKDGENYSRSLIKVERKTGKMSITRPGQRGEIKSEKDGIWTIFVYLCGSDLESDNGAATLDLNEMLSATASKKVRFVVQTGGVKKWNNEVVKKDKLQRFLVQNGDIELVDEKKDASMAKPSTLAKFLKWGVKNYVSEKMGVILWNHGGGSVTGVCFDEKHKMKGLSLKDVDSAFLSVYSQMDTKFEFIGFDACLMGTLETANVAASYANYMFASEESEPGCGWDYKTIGSYLAGNPSASGADLGKVICDSFYASCKKIGDGDIPTLSVLDLSKLDNLLVGFNDFAKGMYESYGDDKKLATITRKVSKIENFGGNNKSEGYTNMVDLSGLADACGGDVNGADEIKRLVDETVVYKISGKNHKKAKGISVYYPICVQDSEELSKFSAVCVSPYYLSFVDRQDVGSCNAGKTDQYSEDYWWSDGESCGWIDSCASSDNASNASASQEIIEENKEDGEESIWCWLADYNYNSEEECYENSSTTNEHWAYADSYDDSENSTAITFAQEPGIDEDGIYGFVLDENGLQNTADVYSNIYGISDDGKLYFEYGQTYEVECDYKTGEVRDYFDGKWISLPDGQNLALYIVGTTEDDDIVYTSPITLNGKRTNLRLLQSDDDIKVIGAWDGLDEEGASARDIKKIKKGDKIVPIYYAYDAKNPDEPEEYEGDTYKVGKKFKISYDYIMPGNYMYSFCIQDVYNNTYNTEYAQIEVDKKGRTYVVEE